jgi:hypothetical protein
MKKAALNGGRWILGKMRIAVNGKPLFRWEVDEDDIDRIEKALEKGTKGVGVELDQFVENSVPVS